MTDSPAVPFGYRQITGQLQKGDGVWNGERFRKIKKQYPNADGSAPLFAIRKCIVTQPELPMETALPLDE